MRKINARRYIGCKTKLVEYIYRVVSKLGYDNKYSFADIFAGTGSVADYFARKGYPVLFNDNLYSNYVFYQGFYSQEPIDENKLAKYINEYNLLNGAEIEDNYFSNVYGGKYFSINDAKKIGYIRDCIDLNKNDLNQHEYYYLITALVYAIDRVANTVGHYESFLNKTPKDSGFKIEMLDIFRTDSKVEFYNMDANKLADLIKYDIVYIDPPYNARQYVNFYHVIENLCRWNKPTEFEGNSMKFKRNELKSDYCRNKAPALFQDLISKLECKLIVVSYNNTYTAKSSSSNNTISEEQLLDILKAKGKVKKMELNYKAFNAGKTDLKNHKEYLFVCEVQR